MDAFDYLICKFTNNFSLITKLFIYQRVILISNELHRSDLKFMLGKVIFFRKIYPYLS